MSRPTKCACGRYIKPLGWANHRKNCEAYQAGLREFAEKAGLAHAPTPAPAPAPGVAPSQAHSKSEYKRRGALGDPNVTPPAGVMEVPRG